MATAPPATGRSRAPRQSSQHYGSSGCVHLTAPPRGSAPHLLASGDLVHIRRCTSTHTLTFVSPEDPRRANPPNLLSSSPGQAELPAPCRAESRALPQGLARLSRSMIPNHSAGWMDWACNRQDFEKMQEFGKKGAPAAPGAAGQGYVPDLGTGAGGGTAALAAQAALAHREPEGTHRKTAHGQVFTARSRSRPPVSSLLPPSPPPAAPINRNSPQSKAGKHKQVTAGLRDAGRRQRQTLRSGLGGSSMGGRGRAGPQRGPTGRQGTGKNGLQVTRHQRGKGRARTARRARIWDREPSQQLDKALRTGTGQG